MPAKFEIVVMDGGSTSSSGAPPPTPVPGASTPLEIAPAVPPAPSVAKSEERELERFAERVRGSLQSNVDVLNETLARLDKAFKAGLLSAEEYFQARSGAQSDFIGSGIKMSDVDKLGQKLTELDEAAEKGAIGLGTYETARAMALEDFVSKSGSATEALLRLEEAASASGATEEEISRIRESAAREAADSQRRQLEGFAERIKSSLETPVDQLGRTLAKLDEAYNAGLVSEDERQKAREKMIGQTVGRDPDELSEARRRGVITQPEFEQASTRQNDQLSGLLRGFQEIANLFGMGGPFAMVRRALDTGERAKSWFEGLASGGDGASAPLPPRPISAGLPPAPPSLPPIIGGPPPPSSGTITPAPLAPALPPGLPPVAPPLPPAPPPATPLPSTPAPVAPALPPIIGGPPPPPSGTIVPPLMAPAASTVAEGATVGTANATSSAISLLGAAAIPAALTLGAIAAEGYVLKKFFNFVEHETDRLARYSGVLSQAQARTQLRREFADIRAAQRLGPELAKFENLRSELGTSMTNIGTEIKLFTLKFAEPILMLGKASVDLLGKMATKMHALAESDAAWYAQLAVMGPLFMGWLEWDKKRRMKEDAEKKGKEADPLYDPYMLMFLSELNHFAPGFPGMFNTKKTNPLPPMPAPPS